MKDISYCVKQSYKMGRLSVHVLEILACRYNPGDVPVQTNGCDCGVFSLIFAEHLSRSASLSFTQEHMQYFRKMIAAAIMDLKLPG